MIDKITPELKSKLKSRASGFTSYGIFFNLLLLIKQVIENKGQLRINMVVAIIFIAVIILIAVLWLAYGVVYLLDNGFNSNLLYEKLVYRKYGPGNELGVGPGTIFWGKAITVMVHPELMSNAENVSFYGWKNDGLMAFEPLITETGEVDEKGNKIMSKVEINKEDTLMLAAWPTVFSEKKNATVRVKSQEACDKADMMEVLNTAVKKRRIEKGNQLFIYPLYIVRDNGVDKLVDVRKLSKEYKDIINPFPLTWEMLEDTQNPDRHVVGERLFDECRNRLASVAGDRVSTSGLDKKGGLVSFFIDSSDNFHTGALVFVELEATADVVWAAYSENDTLIRELIANRLPDAQGYGVMMYLMSRENRHEYVKAFIGGYNRAKALLATADREALALFPKTLANLLVGFANCNHPRKFFHDLVNLINDKAGAFLAFIAVFFLENIIEPVALSENQGLVSLSTLLMDIWNAAIKDILLLVVLVLTYGMAWAICHMIKGARWFYDSSEDKLEEIYKDDKDGRILTIGGNINIFWARNLSEGWDDSHIEINLSREDYIEQETLEDYSTEKLAQEKNNGNKYRVIGITEDALNDRIKLVVDTCHYTDTMKVQNLIALDSTGYFDGMKGDLNSSEARSIAHDRVEKYILAMKNLRIRDKDIVLEEIPPSSLCMHAVIMSKDGFILKTRRGEVSYYKHAMDCSLEEQLSIDDFYNDGVVIDRWIERFIEEELGITKELLRVDKVADYKLLSVFIERDCLNMAITVRITLNASRRMIEKIHRYWPRKDYETDNMCFCTWKELVADYEKANGQVSGTKGMTRDEEYRYHPTAINRMVLVACSQYKYKIAEKLAQIQLSSQQ